MVRQYPGTASLTVKAPLEAVWDAAVSLEWLVGWDQIAFLAPPEEGSAFTLTDEHRPIRARFTQFEKPNCLAWRAADGGSGALHLSADGDSTSMRWEYVGVPHAFVDRIATGAMALFVPGKVKKLCNEDAAKELRNLARRVVRRSGEKA